MPTKEVYARDRAYYLASAKAYNERHRKPRPTLEERLWAKVDKTDGCWLWTGNLGSGGRYGAIRLGGRAGRMLPVHRLTYEWVNGPIPAGLEIDHLCRTPRCVRPDHLEAVTHAENMRRGIGFAGQNSRKTHCVRHGIPLVRLSHARGCRECRREQDRAYRQRKVAAA